jgi:hypothetical protein
MTTPAIDRSVLIIRALLADDMDTLRPLHAGLDGNDSRVFAALLAAVFFKAANDKFGKDYTAADVIEFVAEARAQYVGPEIVSAEDAEHAIRAALGEEDLTSTMSAYARGQAQTAMLVAIVRDAGLSADQIDVLIDAAAQRVRSFFERQARR